MKAGGSLLLLDEEWKMEVRGQREKLRLRHKNPHARGQHGPN